MATKFSIKFNKDNFNDFVSKLQDLTQIEDVVKLKIDQQNILMYSMLANESAILALKSYRLDTQSYIDNFTQDDTFDLVIVQAGKFVKNLKFFSGNDQVKCDIISKVSPDDDSVHHIRAANFSGGKLKISCIGGEQHKIRDIKLAMLEERLNPKKSKWQFKVSRQDFADIRKLSAINSEDKILTVTVNEGKVTLSEAAKWELEVDEIDSPDNHLTLTKKYLSNVNTDSEWVNFSIFETFILVKDHNSNLMLSFEQTFDDE